MSADYRIEERSPVGRTTIEALGMNRPAIVAIRRESAPGLLMQRFALDLLVQGLVVSHGVRACGQ